MKKLKLNKETLIALQQKQMNAAMGGEAGISMSNCQYTANCPQTELACEPAPDVQAVDGEADTCCRKTCRQ